jgi:uncharacterized protein
LTGPVERAGKKLLEFFGSLRPQVRYNPLDGSFSTSLSAEPSLPETRLLADVLDGLDRLAADSGQRVTVIIDEFQRVVEGGIEAERQLRAAVQRHAHVGYVLAGSRTTLLAEMTGDASRPFYRLGSRLFLGPVPRADFLPFLRRGFEEAGFAIDDGAAEAILDLAEDVPYNVQRLAHACWNEMREGALTSLGTDDVRSVLRQVVSRDDPFYTQMWNRLTSVQQKVLLALAHTGGEGLYGKVVLGTYDLPLSTMRTALEALVKTGIARTEETQGTIRTLLEDPFFGEWVRLFVARPYGADVP